MMKQKIIKIDMTKYVKSKEIHEKCEGCIRVFDYVGDENVKKCLAYIDPSFLWRKGFSCPLASNIQLKEETTKVKVNPIKASKRK